MSKCISSYGEYSEHEDDGHFTCKWCCVFDEDGALKRIAELEAEAERDAERIAALESGREIEQTMLRNAAERIAELEAEVERLYAGIAERDGIYAQALADRNRAVEQVDRATHATMRALGWGEVGVWDTLDAKARDVAKAALEAAWGGDDA